MTCIRHKLITVNYKRYNLSKSLCRYFERYIPVLLIPIDSGWMHAGYPIMIHTDSATELFRPDSAKTAGLWGEIHELGHNQQRSCWEFRPHTTDATCNLWSVYVHEEVLGLKREKV